MNPVTLFPENNWPDCGVREPRELGQLEVELEVLTVLQGDEPEYCGYDRSAYVECGVDEIAGKHALDLCFAILDPESDQFKRVQAALIARWVKMANDWESKQ